LPTNIVSLNDGLDGCQVVGLAKASDNLTGRAAGGRKCRWGHTERCYLQGRCSRCRLYNPSLDRNVSSSAVERESTSGGGWSRQQKRGYNRVLSCLQFWQSHGYQVLWLMFSTAAGGSKSALSADHASLIKRVERLGFPRVQHFQVRTGEGNGVLHVLWAWKADDGFRQKSFFIGQRWLSNAWYELHGARIVWICRVGGRRRDVFQVARYCISQYVGNQSFYEYMSYSWKRAFGFPLVSCWRKFKKLSRSFNELVDNWSKFLSGEVVWCDYGGFTMGAIRLAYQDYGREFWEMLHWV
jgi:hypothetical protein